MYQQLLSILLALGVSGGLLVGLLHPWDRLRGPTTRALLSQVLVRSPAAPERRIPLGAWADLGDGWAMAVLAVQSDATAEILAASDLNAPPSPGHQFFLAPWPRASRARSRATVDHSGRRAPSPCVPPEPAVPPIPRSSLAATAGWSSPTRSRTSGCSQPPTRGPPSKETSAGRSPLRTRARWSCPTNRSSWPRCHCRVQPSTLTRLGHSLRLGCSAELAVEHWRTDCRSHCRSRSSPIAIAPLP